MLIAPFICDKLLTFLARLHAEQGPLGIPVGNTALNNGNRTVGNSF